ncbi:hypothetical protein OO013_09110 [Mangrovivirga sp. M17]|uniref:DUF3157 family protein n=1 Tax=Mangrovivirga halotolerans TaxID=2993936 RepID=A0ABT3RRX9_9BACT|nr:hypothetical protein [Mangrovivirga halotolerans]MCX2744022.1 hypothetical protein [Mangrovivirga halotolerans]
MKLNAFFILSILTVYTCLAQKNAITEFGEEVILFEDGSWEYVNKENATKNEIPENPTKFKKDEESSFLLKSQNLNVGFYIDPKSWTFKKANENDEAEYKMESKDGNLYGMVISEKIEIPLTTLKNIALENARSAAPDAKIIKEEYRNVNGLKVLHMQINGTMQGIKFSYYGYYYSDESGTVQFITFTSQNLLDIYKDKCEKLLNGLVKIDM